ncbi:MAG: damage-inducible protein D [Pseudomonadota bacterium]
MKDFSIAMFEDSAQEGDTRFWYSHQLMEWLGYDSPQAFQGVITKAMGACTRLGLDPTEAFIREEVIEDGKPVKSYRLTRFACLLVSMTADSNKPEVAQAKAILAAIADTMIEQRVGSHDLGRLESREDLKFAEKAMTSAAKGGGLQNSEFAIFKDAGFRGMYNMSLRQLQAHKGMPSGKTLYDFMGLEELAGNLFRVTQTAARIKSQDVQGLNRLSSTAQQVGTEVRQMMVRNSGVSPEALPLEEDVSGVQKRLKKVDREMKKLDKPKTKKNS